MEQFILMCVGIISLLISIGICISKVVQIIFRQAQALLVAPLISQISALAERVDMLGKVIKEFRNDQLIEKERISKVETSTAEAHRRIDNLSGIIHQHIEKE